MWIHGARTDGPRTLYPPTPEQFDELIAFLAADEPEQLPCPLPILGTPQNRPRWDPYRVFAEFHIFRDRHERRIREPDVWEHFMYAAPHASKVPLDWPELDDQLLVEQQWWTGVPANPEDVTAALARLRQVTPTSPCWSRRW